MIIKHDKQAFSRMIEKHFELKHHKMQETRNSCFGSKICSTTIRQAKAVKHECRNITATYVSIWHPNVRKKIMDQTVIHRDKRCRWNLDLLNAENEKEKKSLFINSTSYRVKHDFQTNVLHSLQLIVSPFFLISRLRYNSILHHISISKEIKTSKILSSVNTTGYREPKNFPL